MKKKELIEGPIVLILGGVGFIGRNLVKYLVDSKLAGRIRVVDKCRPDSSMMNDIHKSAFAQKNIVEYIQGDLTKEATVDKMFKDLKFDFVFNLCGETRFALSEAEYKSRHLDTACLTGKYAAKYGVKKFVELSTAQVYKSQSKKVNESGKIDPWTLQAKYRYQAELALQKIDKLPLVILRPAIVYGPGDFTGLSPRITNAAVYKKSGEQMKLLWGRDLHLNVVHVLDVCRAMWTVANETKEGTTFNLADDQDLKQGTLGDWLEKLFGLKKIDYQGAIASNLALPFLARLAEDANEDHVPFWQNLCTESKISHTPLSPYIDKELLKDHPLCIDGSKITKETSFKYTKQISYDAVKEQIQFFIDQKVFPPVL